MLYDQCKTCRRIGEKLFLKGERCLTPKCAILRRAYAPGPQSKRRGGAPSAYKKSLYEKQSLKKWYGLSERQFKKYVQESLKKTGKVDDVSAELIKELEKRLDNVIFRLGFASSRAQARQLVNHGHFTINGKPVNAPSFEVGKDDIVGIKDSKRKNAYFAAVQEIVKRKQSPSWLSINKEKLEAKCIGDPNLLEANVPAEISLIFEFYSR